MMRSNSPFAAAVELSAQGLDPAGKVRRQGERADLREEMRRFFGESLDARPTSGQAVDFVACRADFWPQFDVAAMVADEGGAEAVLDQPRRAVGAFEPMPAGAAERERRIAAPVEEEQRLLAALARRLDPRDRLRRQPAPARRPLAFEVHRRDQRQARRAEPRRQPKPAIAAGLGVDPRLERGRRRGEHDRRLFEPRAHHRHVARVVDDAVLLLVGALVLLVDDDRGRGRRKAGRGPSAPRPRPALRRSPPRPRRARAGAAVSPECHSAGRAPKRVGEAVEELRGQRDFRQEHERLPILPQRLGDRLEIDFGLARAGHAFEQSRREGAGGDAGDEIVGGRLLVRVEKRRAEVRDRDRRRFFPAAARRGRARRPR